MQSQITSLEDRYATAAPKWADKMRVLGYYDAYLGFLSHFPDFRAPGQQTIDIGTGTGALAEAHVAVNGTPGALTLLDPSEGMLRHAQAALQARGVQPALRAEPLNDATPGQFDVLLAAHVIEHFDQPLEALTHMRRIARPGARLWLVVSKPHWCSFLIWLKWRHRTFQKAEISSLLNDAGFDVAHFYDFPAGPASRTSFAIVAQVPNA